MAKRPVEDPRLAELSKIALAFPEAQRQVYGSHAQFLVRKKTFAYFLDNHHGDGIVAVTGKVLADENKALAEAQPRRFYLPAYIASKGWVALRLDVGKVDWGEVKELLLGSYVLIAPKRLAKQVHPSASAESAFPGSCSHAGLHLASQVRHDPHDPLNEHQLAPVVHFMFFDRKDHFETALG